MTNLPMPSFTVPPARRIVGITLVSLGVIAAFWLIYRFNFVIFCFLSAVMLHIAVRPLITRLRALGVRTDIAAPLVYVSLLIGIGLATISIVPLFAQQIGDIFTRLPQYYGELHSSLANSGNATLQALGSSLPAQLNISLPVAPSATNSSSYLAPLWQFVRSTGYALFIILIVVVLALYWTLDGNRLMYRLLLQLPSQHRDTARELIEEIEEKVSSFYRGQLILCAFVGGLSTIAYLLIGLPNALLLGALSFVLEAVPMLGPLLGAVPALILALPLGFDKVIWVVAALVVIQQLENNVLVPRVMDKTVGVNAIVTIVSIAAFSLLFGIVGALLAIPLAAILQILVNRWVFRSMSPTPDIPDATTIENQELSESQIPFQRDRLSVLRLEARELAQDVRKRLRAQNDDTPDDHDNADVNDMIESIATDLETLLSNNEALMTTVRLPLNQLNQSEMVAP